MLLSNRTSFRKKLQWPVKYVHCANVSISHTLHCNVINAVDLSIYEVKDRTITWRNNFPVLYNSACEHFKLLCNRFVSDEPKDSSRVTHTGLWMMLPVSLVPEAARHHKCSVLHSFQIALNVSFSLGAFWEMFWRHMYKRNVSTVPVTGSLNIQLLNVDSVSVSVSQTVRLLSRLTTQTAESWTNNMHSSCQCYTEVPPPPNPPLCLFRKGRQTLCCIVLHSSLSLSLSVGSNCGDSFPPSVVGSPRFSWADRLGRWDVFQI